MPVKLLTGVSRVVWGNPTKAQGKTDQRTKQPILRADGMQAMQWSYGLAIPKTNFAPIWAGMQQVLRELFATGNAPSNFSWKFKDCDAIDDKGKPYSAREGYAGCYVLAISTEVFAPPVVHLVGNTYHAYTGPFKTGDWIDTELTIKIHGANPNAPGSAAGFYLNPEQIEFVGAGIEIFNGPDALEAFGGVAKALPPGAVPAGMPGSVAPLAGMPGVAPLALPGAVAPLALPGNPTAPLAALPGMPPVAALALPGTAYPSSLPGMPPVAPAHDFVANAAAPRFDPATGQPIVNAAPALRFDPATGLPVAAAPAQRIVGYDPTNGTPIYG